MHWGREASGEQEQIVTSVKGIKIQQVKTDNLEKGAWRERIRLISLPEELEATSSAELCGGIN